MGKTATAGILGTPYCSSERKLMAATVMLVPVWRQPHEVDSRCLNWHDAPAASRKEARLPPQQPGEVFQRFENGQWLPLGVRHVRESSQVMNVSYLSSGCDVTVPLKTNALESITGVEYVFLDWGQAEEVQGLSSS